MTNGNNLTDHGSLTEFLESENGTDFGHLLNETLVRRVIAVENTEQTEYGRTKQRRQIIRMIAERVGEIDDESSDDEVWPSFYDVLNSSK